MKRNQGLRWMSLSRGCFKTVQNHLIALKMTTNIIQQKFCCDDSRGIHPSPFALWNHRDLRIPFWRNISHRSFFVEEPPASFFQLQCWCRHLEIFWSCGPLRNLLIWTFKLYLVAGANHDLLVSWGITTVNPFKVVETCPRNEVFHHFQLSKDGYDQ